jgi:hypothetical protein
MIPRRLRRLSFLEPALLGVAFFVVTLLVAASVRAGDKPETLEIVSTPIFGPGSLPPGGWGEVLVRITNRGKEPYRGKVTIYGGLSTWSDNQRSSSDAPFSAGAGATISLRIPVRVSESEDPAVRVYDEQGEQIFQQAFSRVGDNRSILVDVAKTSALGAGLRGVLVGSRNDPFGNPWGAYPSSAASTVEVTSPIYDAVTGDALLPQRAAGYARISAVLVRSEELARLPAPELEALAGYVLAGGTLAVVITRPEDLRDPVIVSLCGNVIRPVNLQTETLAPLEPVPVGSGLGAKTLARQPAPEPYLEGRLTGYEGGNLAPSLYGASAAYGLGEIHVLAFDPQTKPAVDSTWVHLRMVDLVRRANERLSGVVFRPGEAHNLTSEVRRQLDPNEGSRWAIVITALLLLGYAVIAGPANFVYWRHKGRPLKALLWLPVASGATFGAVVVVGVVAKGCSGRARHLTMIEAGAGMEMGTARRWRGFFVPSAQEMIIRTSSASSVLGTEITSGGDNIKDKLLVDRDGLRLVDVPLRPWETLVVREDGYAALGEGIAIVPAAGDEVEIVNRSGHRLLGLVLHLPVSSPTPTTIGGVTRFASSLDDGARLDSSSMTKVSRVVTIAAAPGVGAGHGLPIRDFEIHSINKKLNESSSGLTNAWVAVKDAVNYRKDWFPDDVPVLLAELEDGGDRDSDSGLGIDRARVLVRIVGYGGRK